MCAPWMAAAAMTPCLLAICLCTTVHYVHNEKGA